MAAIDNVPLGIAFVAGFLSFISPCVLPLIPAYITYLGGRATMQTSMELSAATAGVPAAAMVRSNRIGTLMHGVFFVAGFTFVFVLFGILVNSSIRAVRNDSYDIQKFLGRAGGLLIIFFGLHVMGVTGWILRKLIQGAQDQPQTGIGQGILRVLERIQALLYGDSRRQVDPRNPYGFAGSALMGVTFAAGWTPCIGPIYGTILIMANSASTNNNYGSVASLLLAYSLGLGVPFLLTAVALDRIRGMLKRVQRQMRLVEVISGVLLIVIGYLLFADRFSYINQFAVGLSDFSYKLEGCTTGVLQGEVPTSEYGTCMNLGVDYKEKMQQSSTYRMPLALLPDGRVLVIRTTL